MVGGGDRPVLVPDCRRCFPCSARVEGSCGGRCRGRRFSQNRKDIFAPSYRDASTLLLPARYWYILVVLFRVAQTISAELFASFERSFTASLLFLSLEFSAPAGLQSPNLTQESEAPHKCAASAEGKGHGSIDRVGGDRDGLDGTELGLFGLLLVADLQLQTCNPYVAVAGLKPQQTSSPCQH
jgi:hypothetical protein